MPPTLRARLIHSKACFTSIKTDAPSSPDTQYFIQKACVPHELKTARYASSFSSHTLAA